MTAAATTLAATADLLAHGLFPSKGFRADMSASVPPRVRLGKPQWNSFLNRLKMPAKMQPAPEGAGCTLPPYFPREA